MPKRNTFLLPIFIIVIMTFLSTNTFSADKELSSFTIALIEPIEDSPLSNMVQIHGGTFTPYLPRKQVKQP